MKQLSTGLATLAILFVTGACGQDDTADAQKAWRAMQKPLSAADNNPNALTYDQIDITTEMDEACSGGGNAHFVDSVNVNDTNVGFSWEVTFTGCVEDGITMDGTMSYTGEIGTSDTGSSVITRYVGDIDFLGDYESACDIDVSTEVITDASGASVSVQGSFCDMDADLIVTDDSVS